MLRNIVLLVGCCIVLGCNSLLAQSPDRANRLFEAGKYAEALPIYQQLLHRSPKNILYTYRTARCLQEEQRWSEAIPLFAKTGKKYVLTYFFLGECHQALWQSEEAVTAFRTYLTESNSHDREIYINAQIALADKRRRYLKRVTDIQLIDSTRVPKSQLLDAYSLGEESGKLLQNEQGTIVYQNQRGDSRLYAVTENAKNSLYRQYKLLANWEQAEKLSDNINRGEQQDFPFVLNDGVTLYFASQSEDGLGGWDIYVSRYNPVTNSFMTAENIGFPFNSEANDYLYAVDEQKGVGYFASDRYCTGDSVSVYRFVLNDPVAYLPRETEHDSLVAYARLAVFHHGVMPQGKTTIPATEKQEEVHEIHFVLNDSTVYTSLQDFRSEQARTLFEQYQVRLADLQQTEEELARLREQYRTATAAERSTLTQTVLQSEQHKDDLQQQVRLLRQQICQLESPNRI